MATPPGDDALVLSTGAVHRETIDYQPHYFTLTRTGKAHFAICSHALAEFIDNSVQSTTKNASRGLARSIDVRFFVGEGGSGGGEATHFAAICDNGCGMDRAGIRDFATYFLTQEERGQKPSGPAGGGAAGGGSSRELASFGLDGFISKYGVGAIQAGFFLASGIKLITKTAGADVVREFVMHEDKFRERVKENQSVFKDEITTRQCGDTSTMTEQERACPGLVELVQGEATGGSGPGSGEGSGEGGSSSQGTGRGGDGESSSQGGGGGGKDGGKDGGGKDQFTTIILSGLSKEHAEYVSRDGGHAIAAELAHIYHYYLHPEDAFKIATGGTRGVDATSGATSGTGRAASSVAASSVAAVSVSVSSPSPSSALATLSQQAAASQGNLLSLESFSFTASQQGAKRQRNKGGKNGKGGGGSTAAPQAVDVTVSLVKYDASGKRGSGGAGGGVGVAGDFSLSQRRVPVAGISRPAEQYVLERVASLESRYLDGFAGGSYTVYDIQCTTVKF